MNAPTTSPSGQPAIDPEHRTPTEQLATPAGPIGGQPSASGETATNAEPPAGMELPPAQPRPPGFRERGRMRRRVRFLRKARELAYRDLGGLVFEMQRLGQRNDELVAAKLGVLASFDTELHALERALDERRSVTVLREAGIAACPRCAAIHGSDDRFCPMCGMPMGRPAESPIAGAPVAAPSTPPPLAAASVAAASSVTPGQLSLSASVATPPAGVTASPSPPAAIQAPTNPPASTTPASPPPPILPPAAQPLEASPPAPAHPTTEAPTGAPAPRAPTPPPQPREEDRPTEIIRPRDEAG